MNNAIECWVCGKLGLLKHQKAIGKTLKKWCGRLLSSVKLLLADCLMLWQASNREVNVSVLLKLRPGQSWCLLLPTRPLLLRSPTHTCSPLKGEIITRLIVATVAVVITVLLFRDHL